MNTWDIIKSVPELITEPMYTVFIHHMDGCVTKLDHITAIGMDKYGINYVFTNKYHIYAYPIADVYSYEAHRTYY